MQNVRTYDYKCKICKFDWSHLVNQTPMIGCDLNFCPQCGESLPRAEKWEPQSDTETLHTASLTNRKILWNAIIPMMQKRKSYMAVINGRQTEGKWKGGFNREFLRNVNIDGQRAFLLGNPDPTTVIEVSGYSRHDKTRQYIVVASVDEHHLYYYLITEKDVNVLYPPLEE